MKNQGPHRSALQGELFPKVSASDIQDVNSDEGMNCIDDYSVMCYCVAGQNEIDLTRGACWIRQVQGI